MRSITRNQPFGVSKFSKICGEKRGWDLIPRHFVVVESIFLFLVFKMRKLIFEKIFRGCRKFLEVVLKMKSDEGNKNA